MAVGMLLVCLFAGCVTVYQPLVGLQRPTVVDPQEDNFSGQKIRVRCIPEQNLNSKQAQVLCQKISTAFSNQGALVQTVVPSERGTSEPEGNEGAPDLTIDTKVRLLSEQSSALLAVASVWTLTLVPNIEEYTFSQEVIIRDRDYAPALAHYQTLFAKQNHARFAGLFFLRGNGHNARHGSKNGDDENSQGFATLETGHGRDDGKERTHEEPTVRAPRLGILFKEYHHAFRHSPRFNFEQRFYGL